MRYRWLMALWLSASGCSVFAAKGDYEDYRSVRLASDPDARLYALQRYAERHPQGLWSDEIEHERVEHETAIFEAGKSTRAGLERYLRAYPEGNFAAQARSRLDAVELIERHKRDEQAQGQQLAAARKQRELELQRTWVTRFAGYWTGTLLKLSNWGAPIPEVARQNPQFSRAFGAAPRPRCTADECVKYYTSPYGVPVPGGTRVERVLAMLLRLRMQAGKLDRAELLMPAHGFSRWYELEQRKVVAAGDAEGRLQAVNWAISRLQEATGALAHGLTPLASYKLAPIREPAIAPSGELTDTTAEDPSEPSKQLSGIGPAVAQPDVATLVQPRAAEPTPDMVLAPLGVTKEGQAFTPGAASPAAAAAAEGGGEVLRMDPLAVPRDAAAASGSAAPAQTPAPPAQAAGQAAAPALAAAGRTPATTGPQTKRTATGAAAANSGAAPAADTSPASVRAFQANGLRVVIFAAAGDATGSAAYDGVIVERATPAIGAAAAKPKRAADSVP